MKIESSRPSEFHQVCKWFETAAQPARVDIYGISGYGGIGKSFLLRHAIEREQPISKGYLTITLDGADPAILGDLMGIYDRLLAPRSIPRGRPHYDYFPRARHLFNEHSALSRTVQDALKRSIGPDDVKKAADWMFRSGSVLNKTIPKTKEFADFEALKKMGVDKRFNEAVELLASLKPLANSSWLPGRIKDVLGITYRERLRADLYQLAADEWISDLSAILSSYRSQDRWKVTHSPIKGLDRLLLVVDDFEILGKTIIDFLTTALVPALERADFHATLIFVGRDDLSDAHVAFQHHLSHFVREKIRLDKFEDDVAITMFREAGYTDSEFRSLLDESLGYPFLVNLLCEAKGGSVSFYQKFYERTTRWMAPTERNWVLPLCYLDRITEGSVAEMLPDAPSSLVLDWFSHEASLRDPAAEWYVIAPYIRRTLKEFHRKQIGTTKCEEMVAKGREASTRA